MIFTLGKEFRTVCLSIPSSEDGRLAMGVLVPVVGAIPDAPGMGAGGGEALSARRLLAGSQLGQDHGVLRHVCLRRVFPAIMPKW